MNIFVPKSERIRSDRICTPLLGCISGEVIEVIRGKVHEIHGRLIDGHALLSGKNNPPPPPQYVQSRCALVYVKLIHTVPCYRPYS